MWKQTLNSYGSHHIVLWIKCQRIQLTTTDIESLRMHKKKGVNLFNCIAHGLAEPLPVVWFEWHVLEWTALLKLSMEFWRFVAGWPPKPPRQTIGYIRINPHDNMSSHRHIRPSHWLDWTLHDRTVTSSTIASHWQSGLITSDHRQMCKQACKVNQQ